MGNFFYRGNKIKYEKLNDKEVDIIKEVEEKWYLNEIIVLTVLKYVAKYLHVEIHSSFLINKTFNYVLNNNPNLFKVSYLQIENNLTNNEGIYIANWKTLHIKCMKDYLENIINTNFIGGTYVYVKLKTVLYSWEFLKIIMVLIRVFDNMNKKYDFENLYLNRVYIYITDRAQTVKIKERDLIFNVNKFINEENIIKILKKLVNNFSIKYDFYL